MRGGLLSCLPEYGPPPMKNNKYRSQSRKATPWDSLDELSSSQEFIRRETKQHYDQRHKKLSEAGETDLINSFIPDECPFCHEKHFKRNGFNPNGVQKYYCTDCRSSFLPTTGTVFQDHKIPITEWIEYWRNLFQYLSLSADSWNNKNAFTTSKYWFKKTCLLLSQIQDDIILSGTVYYDETLIPVRSNQIIWLKNGKKPRGHSRNQMTIGVATDGIHTVAKYLTTGEPTQKMIMEVFGKHILAGSTLITDKHRGHRKLVHELSLDNIEYDSKLLKGIPDEDNPLNPVNQKHNMIQKFLKAHSGFNRDELDDYLNLFVFITNPPMDKLEKIDILLNLAFQSAVSLKYRDYFLRKSDDLACY